MNSFPFQPSHITGVQPISDNTTADTPLISEGECDLAKLIPFFLNLNLWNDTMIVLQNNYQDITLYITEFINYTTPIHMHFHKVGPNKLLTGLIFPM